MKYICKICGYVYDDDKEDIKFSDLPDSWKCPVCGALKTDFELADKQKDDTISNVDFGLKKLTVAELSLVCSNLARGCEKQYMSREAELFSVLAEYFRKISPVGDVQDVEGLHELTSGDVAEKYPFLNKTAEEMGDRGTQRICVWGNKVSRMLLSLEDAYLKKGEAMLAVSEVWLCTVCGFIYIGEKPPELCPVCKVPSWKFEKSTGVKAL